MIFHVGSTILLFNVLISKMKSLLGFLNISVILFLSISHSNARQLRQPFTGYLNNSDFPGNHISDYYEALDNSRNTVIFQIPKVFQVVKKRLFGDASRNVYVDRMNISSYRDGEILIEDYLRLKCGVVDIEIALDYCDCQQVCNVGQPQEHRPSRVDLSYKLSLFMDDNLMYFSAAINDLHADNDPGLVDITQHLTKHDNKRNHFGPFVMADPKKQLVEENNDVIVHNDGEQIKTKLFDDEVLKEWFLFETTEERTYRLNIWNMPDEEELDPRENVREEDDIVVTTSQGHTVSFGRFECKELERGHDCTSDTIQVNKGGCVRVYADNHCTGPNRIVVQDLVRLYSADNALKHPVLRGIRSVSGCCQEPGGTATSTASSTSTKNTAGTSNTNSNKGTSTRNFLKNRDGPWSLGRVPRDSTRRPAPDCNCHCRPLPTSSELVDDLQYRPRPGDVLGFNATSVAKKIANLSLVAKETAVMAATAVTPVNSVSASIVTAMTAKTAAETGAITLAKMRSYRAKPAAPPLFRRHSGLEMSLLERLINETTNETRRLAFWMSKMASPKVSAAMAWDAAMAVSSLDVFVSEACKQLPDSMED